MASSSSPDYKALFLRAEEERKQAEEERGQEKDERRRAEEERDRIRTDTTNDFCHPSVLRSVLAISKSWNSVSLH
jgi:hypothetical protein